MIATRREFLKLSAAGLVLRPITRADLSASDLCESARPLKKGKHWQHVLRPGDSILGTILIRDWRVECAGESDCDLAVEIKLSRGNDVLFESVVNQMCAYTQKALPGTALFVCHWEEVVFDCSSNSGLCTLSFEKLHDRHTT